MVKIEIKSEFETEKKRKTETESKNESEKKRKTTGVMETRFNMKLLIDKGRKKVLFAETGKDCVDVLLFILSLPLSTVVRLLGKQEMVGSVSNLFESVKTLSNTSFMTTNYQNRALLKIPVSANYSCPLLRPKDEIRDNQTNIFGEFDTLGTLGGYMSTRRSPSLMSTRSDGFVKVGKYMVMDDLAVKPLSSGISSINLLNEFNIKDLSQLEEKEVNLGINEAAVKLLKAALESKNVLTSVFLNGNQ